MLVRAIRGATTSEHNNSEEILSATKELLNEIVKANQLDEDNIVSVLFTTTQDLDAVFPAAAARQLGWKHVPVTCASEINVAGSLAKCIRIMMHVYTDKTPREISHIYLKGAKVLRPDLAEE